MRIGGGGSSCGVNIGGKGDAAIKRGGSVAVDECVSKKKEKEMMKKEEDEEETRGEERKGEMSNGA